MKKFAGFLGILLGLLFLSLEIYGLKVLQALEKVHGEWRQNAWGYAVESPCAIALILTIGVILFSLYLFFDRKNH